MSVLVLDPKFACRYCSHYQCLAIRSIHILIGIVTPPNENRAPTPNLTEKLVASSCYKADIRDHAGQ